MCMIAYRPVGAKGRGANIPGSVIDTALRRHPDGFGVAWREGGQLRVERFGPEGAKRFRKVLKRIDRTCPGAEYVAHFRFATHGPRDAAHAHPYEYTHPVDGRVLVFHNGVIDIHTRPHESDTEAFTAQVLARLPSRWWEDDAISFLVTETIGYSKLTVMTADGTYNLHEKRGTWDGGIWYSSSHKASTWPTAVSAAARTTSAISTVKQWGTWCGRCRKYEATASCPNKDRETFAQVLGADPATPIGDKDDLTFYSGGHKVQAAVGFDRFTDADYPGGALCEECHTIGDLYVIDGGIYIDLAHVRDDEGDEEVRHA